MPTPFVTVGKWWVASRYELVDGRIRPAREADLRIYDPWEGYAEARAGKGTAEAPYESLVRLIESEVRIGPGTDGARYSVADRDVVRLLDWCARYGLLGVLMQRVETVTLAGRWFRLPTEREDGDLVPAQVRLVRSAGAWEAFTRPAVGSGVASPESREGALVTGITSETLVPPHVILRDIRARRWLQEPLKTTWWRFFPNVPSAEAETFRYPRPTTREFSAAYSEPLDDFIDAALVLRDALRFLASARKPDESESGFRDRLGNGRLLLQALTDWVSPVLSESRDGTAVQVWVAPTLLASFGMMLMQDLASRRRRFLRCQVCEAIFVTDAYQAEFCSPTCRRTAYKRRLRARRSAERHAARKSAPT